MLGKLYKKKSLPFYVPSYFKQMLMLFLLWVGLTPWLNEWDLALSRVFYQDGHFSSDFLWSWIYHYGLWPAWIIFWLAVIGLVYSFCRLYPSWYKPCLFLILVFIIGPGLVIHAGFKDYWGRPRPKQIEEFGGQQSFRPYYQPNFWNQPEPSKSFTCGHCSLGFYFFTFVLLGKIYQLRYLYWLGMGLTGSLGGLLSLARIAQGGHFLSDTLASATMMWLVTSTLAYLIFVDHQSKSHLEEKIDFLK
jgi:lipid A 4'-phosphatase